MLSLAASTLSYSTPHVTVEEHMADIKPFEMISSMINGNKSSTWTATVPTRFDNLAAVKQLCGTFPLEEKDRQLEQAWATCRALMVFSAVIIVGLSRA